MTKGAQYNMYAFLTDKDGQGMHPHGEKGADTKLLRLIKTHQVHNVLIVVTRWVGSHIRYDRFKIIEDCAGRVISDHVLNSSLTSLSRSSYSRPRHLFNTHYSSNGSDS